MSDTKIIIPKPSEIMRANRPHLYSDSENTDAYRLSESELSHNLETLTDRNQHKDFENFARKICEREICPNLRPQTGPEGGGDGKVDTETYPVDTKIAERWFFGNGITGAEKWGFAFSAKKDWSPKVRSDVKGIVDTARGYEKVFFITSRAARAKDRLRIEDELKTQYGITVTILDREWLIDRVFSNNHKDLAYVYLKAGSYDLSQLKVGPNDFQRQQALDEIEGRLSKLGDESPDYTQAISDTFEAASLSRKLERPPFETEGRFLRATTFARKYGLNVQLLRAVYEHAWTRFWWFDDVQAMQALYEQVEEIAFATDSAHHISKVCNLLQLLVGRVLNGHESADALSLTDRSNRLKLKLEELASDKSRPNNALHAETHLLFHNLSERSVAGSRDHFDEIWVGLSSIIDRASGLGEFPADLLDSLIDAISPIATDSKVFDALIEKLAEFMSERDKERKAGDIYLKQGERKLDADKPIEAIKSLGRAVVFFMKEESREEQFRALYCLSVGYRGVGLLWAARGAALAAIGLASALSEQDAEIRVQIIPSYSLLAMVSLQLGHITDFLSALQYLQILAGYLPLDEDSQTQMQEKLVEFDRLFACLLVALPDVELQRLVELPDILEQLQLFNARAALLYRLGYLDILRKDGSIPELTTDVEVREMMEIMASQPASRDLPKQIVLLDNKFNSVKTIVLGVNTHIEVSEDLAGYLLAEVHVSFLEAFVSTLLNSRTFPHRETLMVTIKQSNVVEKAITTFSAESGVLSISIPTVWDLTKTDHHAQFIQHLVEFGGEALTGTLIFEDPMKAIEELVGIERAFERATLFCRSGMLRHRFLGASAGQVSDWSYWIKRSYQPLDNAPVIYPKTPFNNHIDPFTPVEKFGDLKRHDNMSVSSIINQHLWDAAQWKGFLYGYSTPDQPPFLGLVFSDEQKGRAIFREWRERFGESDENDEIRISVIKGIDRGNPFHYRGNISRDLDVISKGDDRQFVSVSRLQTMEVDNHVNLNMFLSNLAVSGYYYLLPAVIGEDGNPKLIHEYTILKRKFNLREAWQVGTNDVDLMAIRPEDDVIIPDEQDNPPINELVEWRRQMDVKRNGNR